MRKAQLQEITNRLDKIIQILSDQTYISQDATPACQHERADDIGTMGTPPGERMICRDCGAEFKLN